MLPQSKRNQCIFISQFSKSRITYFNSLSHQAKIVRIKFLNSFFFYIFGKRLYGIISFHKPIKKNIDLFLLTRYVFPSFINSKKISNKTVQSSFFFLLKSNLKIKVAHPNKKCINNAPSINFFFSTKNLAQIINDVHILS